MSAIRGTRHHMWRGDAASPQAKRTRAQVRFALGVCQECGRVPATDRHHKDRDPGNNAPENVALLCRRCHMAVDGRLEAWLARASAPREVAPSRPCLICGRPYKRLERGRCPACAIYLRRTGSERPVRPLVAAKLSEAQRQELVRRYERGGISQEAVAAQFGVNQTRAGQLIRAARRAQEGAL